MALPGCVGVEEVGKRGPPTIIIRIYNFHLANPAAVMGTWR